MAKIKKSTGKSVGPVLYSRTGNEEGFLLEGDGGEIVAYFLEESNRLVSSKTLMRWAKQAQAYEKALLAERAEKKATAARRRAGKKKSPRKSEAKRLNNRKK